MCPICTEEAEQLATEKLMDMEMDARPKLPRLGIFSVSTDFIQDTPQCVRDMMARVIIVRAEAMWPLAQIEYTAICDDFDEVEFGMLPPRYTVYFRQDHNGKVHFDGWRRV